MMQNPSNYINDWLWHRVHVSADGLTMERDVSGWEKTSRLFMLSRVPADASVHMGSCLLLSAALCILVYFFFQPSLISYIFTHGFLNTFVFQLESLCLADSFPFGCKWSLTSSLICESYLNEHMYGSKVHFSFCVIASLKHFCTNWSAAWNNPLDFKYYRAPLFTKQSYCHSCLLIVWKGCLL